LITTSPASAAAFIAFARVEAISLLTSSAHIVQALANELRIKRTMDGGEIDATIERAVGAKAIELEHQGRDEWRRVIENAARFAASTRGEP
jgi:RES domain-containing protein